MANGKKSSSLAPVLLIGGVIAAVIYFLSQKATVTANTALGPISIPATDLSTAAGIAKQAGITFPGQ